MFWESGVYWTDRICGKYGVSVLYESMANCVRRCVDVYAQLSENVGWRRYEEMSDENGVNDDKIWYCGGNGCFLL
jgi:hypothetical protein